MNKTETKTTTTKIFYIHQMWLDVDPHSTCTQVPDRFVALQKTVLDEIAKWRKTYASQISVVYKLWNSKMIRELMDSHEHLRGYRDFFENGIHEHIERCDFARYMIMSVFEGMYLDLDHSISNFKAMITHHYQLNTHLTLFLDQYDYYGALTLAQGLTQPNSQTACNAVLWSRGICDFWKNCMHNIRENYRPYQFVFENTGPVALSRCLRAHQPGSPTTIILGIDDQTQKASPSSSRSNIQIKQIFQESTLTNHDTSSNWVKSSSHILKISFWMMRSFWDVALFCILLVLLILGLILYHAFPLASSSSSIGAKMRDDH